MVTTDIVGSLAGLWRFPVKSMKAEQSGQAELSDRGLLGDRGYALIDTQTAKVVSTKSVRLFPFSAAAQRSLSPHGRTASSHPCGSCYRTALQ
jgi:uncharacterized protein YcbX